MNFLILIMFSAFVAASAAASYNCEPFKNKAGQSLAGLSASIVDGVQDQPVLAIGQRFGIAVTYDLVNTNKGPVFNLYTYDAGPYKIFFYQSRNEFEVRKNGFKAVCKEFKK